MKVTDAEGHEWKVHRQWAPRLEGRGFRARHNHHRAKRGVKRENRGSSWHDWLEIPDLPDSLSAAAIFLLVAVAAVLLVLIGLPLLFAIFDGFVVIALVVAGVVARVVFRRPWTVEAVADDGRRSVARVVGWRASGRLRDDLAQRIDRGSPPPDAVRPRP